MKKSVIILLLLFCLLLCSCGKADDYEEAVAMMDAGEYESAMMAFSALERYKDSAEKMEECQHQLRYEEANELFASGSYKEARDIYLILGNVEEAALAEEAWCRETYDKAVYLMDLRKYTEAIVLFEQLGGYADSLRELETCYNIKYYLEAEELLHKGKYEEALELFTKVPDYKDSAKQAKKCREHIAYANAKRLFEEEAYVQALEAFKELENYADSAERVIECEKMISYVEAEALFAEEKYEEALAVFKKLGEFADSVSKVKDCENALAVEKALTYNDAIALMDRGYYSEAAELFCSIRDYKDSEDYWEKCSTIEMLDNPIYQELLDILGIELPTESIDYGNIADGGTYTEVTIRLKNGNCPEPEYSIEMGSDCHVIIPTTYGELYNAGWRAVGTNWQAGYELENAELSDNYPWGKMMFGDMQHENGKTMKITLKDLLYKSVELRAVPVIGISMHDFEMKDVYINGITQGATAKDIVEAFGQPSYFSCVYKEKEYTEICLWYADSEPVGNRLDFYINPETGALEYFSYSSWPER